MHLDDALGLFRDLIGEVLIIVRKELNVLSRIGIVGNEELVTSSVLAVVEITDRNEIDLLISLIVEMILCLIPLELFEPLKNRLLDDLMLARISTLMSLKTGKTFLADSLEPRYLSSKSKEMNPVSPFFTSESTPRSVMS